MSRINEIHFEDTVFDYLKDSRLYTSRFSQKFNLDYVLDVELLQNFITTTQPEAWQKLQRQYPTNTMDAVASEFAKLRDRRGILNLLREGFVLQGATIKLISFKPSSGLNEEHRRKYEANRFSVIRQVHYSSQYPDKSLDLVIGINGIPIITMELKNEFTGQNVTHAIEQYSKRRDSKDPFLRNCLVHFAVDNNTVMMTTKLENGNTRFLPFNRDTKNPIIENKFASSYLWEDILQADSLLEILNNYVFYEEDEKTKEVTTIFPRYHQRDGVRKLVAEVKHNGTGKNYLIQHSAGSGKSKTIAWLAHQLSNLFGANDQPIFDSVIVITDRIVLDRQLKKQIKQFEKIKGTVRTIDKGSKQLMKALEDGDKIIISTLQKFGYIADLAKLNGKHFAIVVDEAHSSQSGENVKDLKLALTTDEALKNIINQDEENSEPKDTVEAELEKVMASRQRLPHLSFFAFTATPKQKTLELFGNPDATQKRGFRAFHEYTMRQAIEEGFILDVLQNYTTKSTFFELIENEKAEEGKEFEKLKAKRLLMAEVNKHPFSISAKSHIMLNYFMEKTIHKIGGRAKSMLVTSSRAHAVLYKQAFDKIIKEQGFDIQTLVAFSGTVEIDNEKYTEENMNGPRVKDIAEEYAKPGYKVLIVANKFQTGFDQPLLHTMFVDKALGGVATVQTLSRLNRTTKNKQDTFVIDFVNKQEDIQADFQDYYQSTSLDKATDTQKLYNLKYEIEKVDVFTVDDVTYFIEMFVRKKVKSEVLSPFFKKIVDERYIPLAVEDKDKFRKNVNKYVRQYSFISQIITFIDTDLEKFYLFTKLLFKYLPYEKETLPLEVTQMVDMDKFRIQEEQNGAIILKPEDAELENTDADGHIEKKPEPKEILEVIVKEINEKYAIDLGEADKVIKGLREKLMQDENLKKSFSADNVDQLKKLKLKESIDKAFLSNVDDYLGFMNKIEKDQGLSNFFMSQMFHWYNSELKQQSKEKPEKKLTVQGIPVKFYRNNYINSFSEFWKIEALFKKDEVKFVLNSFSGEISDASIERLFEKPTIQFYTDKNEKTLFSYSSSNFTKKYGELIPINALTALKEYGIDKLEKASEKGYTRI
ncbi:MAG TPA: DEAD/DEAH box helicase family protein [Chitinophagales bacterium]|nr:DEAD/DEAH box helicase family protein [Chitinophagales bacterium]HNG27994.1 DEAD/DEAH box helicase family protein [Chitinophagales bacterium]HNL05608.1 DEAD/DEAH box helicase family protein [Bacteroidia bacterium]